jgi:acyl-phosphate glycerol 3-phosphate acyltransferase
MRAKFVGEGGAEMSASAWLPVAFVLGYLLGSIPFGLILTRLAGTQDLRSIGSGNIGATNVLRTGRKGVAAATLLLDMLKGTAAVIIASSRVARTPRCWPHSALFSAISSQFGLVLRAARVSRFISAC